MENKFTISKGNWDKIINYAQASYDEFKAEIGGMSIMVKQGNVWELLEPVILKQDVSAGSCDLDKEALAVYYSKVAYENQDREYRICWWHSHHTMDAFWSGTDKKAIEEYNQGDVSFALVVNLREEYKFRVSVWQPLEHGEDIELEIYDWKRAVPKDITDEVKQICSKEVLQNISRYRKTYNGYGQPTLFNSTHSSVPESTKAEDFELDITYAPIQAALDFAEQISGEYSDATISRKEYSGEVAKFNTMLNNKGITYTVKVLSKKDILTCTYNGSIGDYIESEENDIEGLIRDNIAEGWS